MLDLPRLSRIRLTRHPKLQHFVGYLLMVNYGFAPGAKIEFEHEERLPDGPVIFAMNHTDRYNYFPFQYRMWRRFNRFTATWVKGKYYESRFVGTFMEKTNQLPTVSRGYLLTKDFSETIGRKPSDEEYQLMRRAVDALQAGSFDEIPPILEKLPRPLISQPRNVLGQAFDPSRENYPAYIDSLFHAMMRRFVELNELVPRTGLDLLIFPQGTRSIRLLPGHIGISQIALHLKLPIVPIGCNGCDVLYPGGSPWAKHGHVVYRFGEPLHYDALSEFHIGEPFEPFSSDAEQRHQAKFRALADVITDRIEDVLDEPYKRGEDAGVGSIPAAERFI